MNILGLILARGGSKRLPGKNVRLLGGKPLLAWTILAAQESGTLDDLLLSTDDAALAALGEKWGARAPWLRPEALATDTASSMDALFHAVEMCTAEGRRPDAVLLLQPTSPFRSVGTIRRAVAEFREHLHPLVAVSPAQSHPAWCYRLDAEGKMLSYCDLSGSEAARSQDLPPAYQVNGCLYLARTEDLLKHRSYFTPETHAFIIDDPREALDIDDAWDWKIAELIAPEFSAQGAG
ncbi:MAG: acylneuraminate cytidylyltransferase family protein [Betaproteobacteria bacterium]|nr:acylneuraminate cytidylyltransferase family protein [Betaproteobacteria bacterium]